MQCPLCHRTNTLGVLTFHSRHSARRRLATFFCSHCYIEFTTQNGRVVDVVTIDDDGDTQAVPVTLTL